MNNAESKRSLSASLHSVAGALFGEKAIPIGSGGQARIAFGEPMAPEAYYREVQRTQLG